VDRGKVKKIRECRKHLPMRASSAASPSIRRLSGMCKSSRRLFDSSTTEKCFGVLSPDFDIPSTEDEDSLGRSSANETNVSLS
jgi:hypothetical protein